MHERAGLIERNEGERNPEHHRRQRDAPLDERARRVQGRDARSARAIFAADLEVLDDRALGFVILDRLPVRRAFRARSQKIGFAHVERIEAALASDRVHDPLDGDHPLRAAEAAKCGVGDGVGLEAAGEDRDLGEPIAIAGVEHRAIHDAGRKIRRAAAARVQRHVVAGDHAMIVVTDAPIGAEIMALAGQRKIVVAIEANLARTSRRARAERGNRRPGAGLTFLAAESAAHAPRLDRDERVRNAENAGDNVLRLGRVLRRGVHRHFVAFAGHGERSLAFEIEMFLPADFELAGELVGGLVDRGRGLAPSERIILLHALAGYQRVGDGDGRRFRSRS